MPSRGVRVRRREFRTLKAATVLDAVAFAAKDCSTTHLSAHFLLRGHSSRDPSTQIARLADQFIAQNRARFGELDLSVGVHYDGASVELVVQTGIKVGAIPLISPTTGRWTMDSLYGRDLSGPAWGRFWCDRLADRTRTFAASASSAFSEKNPALGSFVNDHCSNPSALESARAAI